MRGSVGPPVGRKPGTPFNATPHAHAANSESRGQNTIHRVPLLTIISVETWEIHLR
jgi:hypothetical protein